MINALRQVFRIQSAMTANRFLFWMRRIPLVKNLFSDTLYGATDVKEMLLTLVEIFKIISAFLGKFIYLALVCVLPLIIPYRPEGMLQQGWTLFVLIFFFLSFFAGTLMQSLVLSPTLMKYTCVRQMGMNARSCLAATAGLEHVSMLITFTPALMVAAALFGQSPLAGLTLSVELAATRLLTEFFYVRRYTKGGFQPNQHPWFTVLIACIGLFCGYLPLFLATEFALPRFEALLLNPITLLLLLALSMLAGAWLLRYPDYRHLVYDTCRAETVSAAAAKQTAAQAAFKDVQMKAGDLDPEDGSRRFLALRGYAYLNALFFRRHRRMLLKPVKYELLGIAALLAAGVVSALVFPEMTARLFAGLPLILPVLVFAMYLMCNTVGMRICKAMFYNCDNSLLKFGWYRQRAVVLKNFTLRLRRITGLNLLVAGAGCLALLIPCLLSGAQVPARDLLPFFGAILCLALFFSVHPIFMYYIFQPYTSNLAVKNPFFGVINGVVYVLCYACLQIDAPTRGFAFLVLVATVLYSAVALVLVFFRAPKTFRVK